MNAVTRPRRELASESGAGTVLAVSLLGALVLVTGVALFAVAVLAAQQGVQNAADSAALAAADTLSGRSVGYPCENAARAARLNDASVTACSSDNLIATVAVVRDWASLRLTAEARAGPPGSP
ncbi:Rv3654c family TadE-like protein [Gryllotalpicola reticulitermitis]|uniref:Rv3654c family TadE-like protein n=1 Tax=Gryllotalpicola reticulitermitis TaxID=1184153 RepID=A0ABV8Q707_9MICO